MNNLLLDKIDLKQVQFFWGDRMLNLTIFSYVINTDSPSIRWGQEQQGVKENEIQIVTLEKQKDTYQVSIPKTDR